MLLGRTPEIEMEAAEDLKSAEVIKFIPKPSPSGPSGPDWLRALPEGSFFLSKPKAGPQSQSAFFDRWGIAAIIPEAVLVASPHRNNPTAYEFTWVDSKKFSDQNKFIALLPKQGDVDHQGEGDG